MSLKISSFCRTGSGTTPSRSKQDLYYGGGIPWVKSGELRESVITETEETVTQEALTKTSLKLAPKGAILVAMYGANVGRVGILGIDATTNQAVCHLIPEKEKANSRYLFHALQQKLPDFISRGVGGAQPNISQQIIRETEIFLPPIAEQKRIAAILDKAEELRSLRRKALAELDAIVQSIFLEMFGDPRSFTNSQKVVSLSSICHSINDGTHKTPSYVSYGVPFITVKNIVSGKLDFSNTKFISEEEHQELTKRTKPENGDVLVSKDGTIGVPCPIQTSTQFSIFVSVALLKPKTDLVDQIFLVTQLSSGWLQEQIKAGTKGIAIRHLHLTDFKRLKLFLPPLPLQQEFARRVEAIDRLKATQRQSLAQLDTLFASLQHRAFQGEL